MKKDDDTMTLRSTKLSRAQTERNIIVIKLVELPVYSINALVVVSS
jgi:hypothetical protein